MTTDRQPDELLGRQLPRAKPVTLTFYDSLLDYPYTTTFYVREDASLEQVQELIRCVDALSSCVLGKYKIGYDEYIVPDFRERVAEIDANVMGTFRWRIVYMTENSITRSHTIPGRNIETSLVVTKRFG